MEGSLKGSVLFASLFLASTTGCGVSLDAASLKAEAGAPESTRTEVVKIPYNASLPTYVVAVEPFVFRETHAEDSNVSEFTFRRGGEDLAAKFTTALANVGNFSVIDSGLKKSKDGVYSAKLKKGESGPYIVKATVTEFTEVAEASSSSRGGSLGWVGLIAGVAGAVSGNSGLAWSGAGVAAANPTYESEEAEKKGMVGIDFRVVDGRTGRVVSAFKSTGTFKSASASKGISLFGIGGSNHKFAQSVLGQAVSVALNDAVTQMNEALAGPVKTAQK